MTRRILSPCFRLALAGCKRAQNGSTVAHLLLSVVCFLACGCGRKGEPPKVWVGAIAPFTGPDRAVGEHARQGIDLALEDLDKEGQPLPGRTVAFRFPDNAGNPADDEPIAVRLIRTSNVVALLAGGDAAGADRLAAVVDNYKVPLLTPADLPGSAAGAYVFHTGLSPARAGELLARFAAGDRLKAKQVAVLTAQVKERGPADAARNSTVADAFTREWRKGGRKLGGEWTFTRPADLKRVLERVHADPPQALLLAGTAADLLDLHDAGLSEKIPVLFGGPEGSLPAGGGRQLPHTVYAATAFAVDEDVPAARDFVARYRKKYGDGPDAHALAAYDDARLLFEAVRKAEGVEGPALRKALTELTDFPSVTGPLSFKDQWAVRPAFIVRSRQGAVKTVARFKP